MKKTSTRQKIGLAIAGLLSALSILSVLNPAPDGTVGPPLGVLILASLLGVVGLVAVVIAWRTGNRAAVRVAAGALIVPMLTALPAFFIDVPVDVKAIIAIRVLVTITAVVLMFSPARRVRTFQRGGHQAMDSRSSV